MNNNFNLDEPEMRFPDFTDNWCKKRMKDICFVSQGLQIPISERFTENGENRYFYITNEFLKENAEKEYYIENPPKSVICTEKDVLMTRTGNTGKVITNVNGVFHNNFFKIDYDDSIIDKDFLCYFLNNFNTQKMIMRLAGTSTIPDLNHKDFYSIKISFPTIKEQQKISDFLMKIDKKIELLEKHHVIEKKFKKNLIENMFFNESAIKNDKENFNSIRLGDLCEIYGRIGFRGYTVDDLVKKGDGALTIGGKHINKNFRLDLNEPEYLSWEKYEESPEIKVQNGDILFVKTASVGKLCHIDNLTEPATINPQLVVLKNIKINSKFLYYYMVSNIFQKQIHNIKSTTGIPTITQKELKNIILHIPSKEKQEKVSKILSTIDRKDELIRDSLENMKKFKKGLLQKMFI